MVQRAASVSRTSKETRIELVLAVDSENPQPLVEVSTGVGFLDHLIELTCFWAGFDLKLTCVGDLHIDAHHTVEDVGLCLGQALWEALGDRAGVARVGNGRVPMDEALATVDLDLSGRPYLVYDDDLLPAIVAGHEKDVFREFFKSVANNARMNLHIRMAYGKNGHHLLESAAKGLGLALAQATARTRRGTSSTKGRLD